MIMSRPTHSLRARLLWLLLATVLGGTLIEMDVLGLGIMFQALAPAMESGLRAHLDRLLGAVD